MKKLGFILGLILLVGSLFVQNAKAGPGIVRGSKVVVYEVISDSTIDGFIDDLLTNTDSNYVLLVTSIEVEFDTGTAYTSAGADSVFIYTRTDADTTALAYIDYPFFTDTIGFTSIVNLEEVKTNGLQYWIDSPASEFAVGDRNYTIRLYYIKRRKEY